jgi:hypothetical protein
LIPTAIEAIKAAVDRHRAELIAALALVCIYLAVMSGHSLSIDGLVMWRQALAMTYHHSWSFVPPIWWSGVITSSGRGVGASLEYVPGLLLFPWLAHYVPVQPAPQYDFRLFYGDPLYIVAGAPTWVVITAATAFLVGAATRALGGDRRVALWAMAFYGLGSPALQASRGDWPQPLVALCWVAGIYACLRFNASGSRRWLWISAASLAYGVLTRPLEGSLLLPGVLLLLMPAWRRRPLVGVGQVAGWLLGVLLTLLFNWARFGGPLNFAYPASVAWTTPLWVGFPSALLSPGRGVLWEFPALVLTMVGAVYLWRKRRRLEVLALTGVPAILFLESCQYFEWVGGWDWGFRFFQPAFPLVAILAGLGVMQLAPGLRRWLPAVLLVGGILWNIPAVTVDLLGGYAAAYGSTASNWSLDAYPPIGAWRFLHHIRPVDIADSSAVDIVWVRATRYVGWWSLIPLAMLLGLSVALWLRAISGAAVEALGGNRIREKT